MIYKFRVILDIEDDVFRDIEISKNDTLEDFQNAIVQAFGFEGGEMASFYLSNDSWEQGEEYPLFDVGESENPLQLMADTPIDSVVENEHDRLIFIYDFLSMWTFLVELMQISDVESTVLYPRLIFSHGIVPEEAPEKFFESDFEESNDDFDDFGVNEDDLDNLDFDINLN